MDINNNTLTNIFTKGMNTDTSDMLLSPELYREAVNLRLSTNTDGNNGELHMIEGMNKYINNIFNESGAQYIKNDIKILKVDSIRDIIVIIIKIKREVPDVNPIRYFWLVITYDLNKQTNKVTGEIPTTEDWGSYLSTVLNWESYENVYMYIADGENPILKVNLNGDSTQTYDDMVSYQGYDLDPLSIQESLETGELVAGKVLYTYRIYNQHSTVSQLSPISNVLSIYKNSNSGYAEGKRTSHAVLITGLPTNNRCLIFRIHYISAEQPPVITMIYDGKLTSSTYVDRGTETVSTLSLAEYTSLKTNLILKPKIIESKDEYLYAANILGTNSNFNIDVSGVTFDVVFSRQEGTNNIYTDIDNERCFREGETYRFGAVFYDKLGNRSDVIHIKNPQVGKEDWTVNLIPENPTSDHDKRLYNFVLNNEGGSNTGDNEYSTSNIWHANKIICNVTISNIPNDISKVEIVRAERNIENYRTISLGIIGNTLMPIANISSDLIHENRIFPSYLLTRTDFTIKSTSGSSYFYGDGILALYSNPHILLFSSPEVVYREEKTNDIFKEYEDKLYFNYVLHYTIPYAIHTGGTNFFVPEGSSFGSYDTLYTIKTNNTYPQTYSNDTSKSLPIIRYSETINGNTVYTCGYDSFYCYFPIKRQVVNWEYYKLTSRSNAFTNTIIAKSNLRKDVGSGTYESDIKIGNIKFVDPPQYNKLSDGENFTDDSYSVTIENKEFIPFTTYYESSYPTTRNNLINDFKTENRSGTTREQLLYTPKSTTGKSILLSISDLMNQLYNGTKNTSGLDLFLLVSVVDIYKEPADYNKYCKYLSFGDYINNTSGSGTVKLTSGDCYFLIFEYNAAHVIYDYPHLNIDTVSTIYRIPICSYIDMSSEYGTSFTKQNNNYQIQDKACAFLDYVQDKSCYLYNPVYGDIDLVNHSFEKYEDEAEITSRDATIYVSLKKENGEIIDNWLLFRPADFLDLSYKYGQITDLAAFNNQLIAWQEDAVALVSTNERQLVNSTTDTEIVLGNGGPLARYDYITTKYGMKEDLFCHAKSNTGLYWWDYDRRELLAYGGGQQVVPLTTINNLRNYINSGSNNDSPYLMYDHKYKELLASIINTNSLVYNEAILAFTGIYTFLLGENTEVEGNIYLAKDSSIYQWNQSDNGKCKLYDVPATPSLTYIVNKVPQQVKVYDNAIIGGSIYGNSTSVLSTMDNTLPIRLGSTDINEQDLRWQLDKTYHENTFDNVSMKFKTPLNQSAEVTLKNIVTINEYDFRLAIPRSGQTDEKDVPYGNRMRGKTMECTIESSDNSTDFSLQYIITKYRTSWS